MSQTFKDASPTLWFPCCVTGTVEIMGITDMP